jgi:hypothetical protein
MEFPKMRLEYFRWEFVDGLIRYLAEGAIRRRIAGLAATRFLFLNGLFGVLLCLSAPAPAPAQERTRVDARKVEAAFLRNFTHYVTWPEEVFTDPHSPWRICVVGDDPFGEVLEKTFEGRTEKGRPFSIQRTRKMSELKDCQIVFVAYKVSANRRAALSSLKGLPVLTVSNAPGFLQEGGIIHFNVTDYVELSVNLDQARAASLSVQTKVLEVSRAVLENGALRRLR